MDDRGRDPRLHLGIAEQGKLLALDGHSGDALRHFREAMRLAVQSGAEEVFFRHYTQCTLETLERIGSYAEILEFCERAEAHYEAEPPPNELAELDLATIRQRKGVILAKMGRTDEAKDALRDALATVPASRLPLAERLNRWLQMGLTVDARRLDDEQLRHNYFVIRKDNVDPSRAIRLPDGLGMPTPTR